MAEQELAKDLGLLSALTIGIGTMIGAGIFVLPGPAAGQAGPAVVLSFFVGGVIALINALSVSELGTAMPKAGGGYYYVNRALGPLFGSIAGLGDWMGLAFASAFYSLGFGSYLGVFLPLPAIDLVVVTLSDIQLGALLAGVIFVGVNYIGAKETGSIQIAIVLTLVSILAVFTGGSLLQADLSTLRPFAPQATGGYSAVLPATALVFVSYLGYAKIATVGEEIKNPGRNLPIAIIGSVLFVTIIYTVMMTVMMGVINWDVLAESDTAVVDVAGVVFGNYGYAWLGVGVLTFAGLLATASSANASILSSARINFAMGRDKIVTDWLNEIHVEYATPYRSILVTGLIIFLFIVIGDVATLAKAGSVLHLMVYGLMNIALIVFREADVPEYNPDFRVPLYPITPIAGSLLSFGLITFMAPIEIGLSLLFVVGAVLWYFGYARHNATDEGVLGRAIQDRPTEMPDLAVAAVESVAPTQGSSFRVMVPLANPETESSLISLASALADARDGTVVAVHIVTVPDQTPLSAGSEYLDQLDTESEQLLEQAKADAETFDVEIETHTVFSHRRFEEIFDAARSLNADQVVMGWGRRHAIEGRTEGALDELARELPCDFLVLKDRGLDTSRILVPTAGGPDSVLSAEVAATIRAETDADVTLLHVVEGPDRRADGHRFLGEWAAEHDLGDADIVVDTSGDVESAIREAASDHTLVIIGATERGLLSRLVRGSLTFDVIDELTCSVLLAERPTDRSLWERLFAR